MRISTEPAAGVFATASLKPSAQAVRTPGLPFTAADIIDADDWLIEQPCPPMRMSWRTPSAISA